MGEVKLPRDVKLIAAIAFRDENLLTQVKNELCEHWGPVDTASLIFDFSQTNYYESEMGVALKKQFIVFQKLVQPDYIIDAKLISNEIEQKYAIDGKRQVNIDPGYISAAKLVLATTKNYMHRVYMGKGIYGDVHLKVSNRRFVPNEWTYPDYQTPEALEFFNKVRQDYLKFNNL
ncbi:DUF4416 family protein [candidate division KSB1 bacterium]|nr:DUF4416 family protein [candidate division KSB1 bacterium]